MKILMLGWELPPHNSGGLGVACYQLCKALAMQGVNIEFVLPYRGNHDIDFMHVTPASRISAERFKSLGNAYDSHCYHCNSDGCTHATPKDLRAQQQQFTEFVESHAPRSDADVIHMHDWLTFEAGMLAKQLTGKPLVAHVHATEFDRSGEHSGNPLVHEIEYTGLLMADRIVAVSNITKDIIVREYGIAADKIEVAHNSIDVADFTLPVAGDTYPYLRAMQSLGYKVVVSLSRLTVQKGLTHLLRAAQQAIQIDPKILFVITGDGEQRDELIALSATYGISQNVIFTGFVRGKQWRDTYDVGDMFVMPSVSEPFGLTALEAAGHGNAILLSNQSGVGEVLRSALKFDFWDTTRLADQILAVAQHSSLRDNLRDNAQREFTRLSWDGTAAICKKLYDRALQAPQGAIA